MRYKEDVPCQSLFTTPYLFLFPNMARAALGTCSVIAIKFSSFVSATMGVIITVSTFNIVTSCVIGNCGQNRTILSESQGAMRIGQYFVLNRGHWIYPKQHVLPDVPAYRTVVGLRLRLARNVLCWDSTRPRFCRNQRNTGVIVLVFSEAKLLKHQSRFLWYDTILDSPNSYDIFGTTFKINFLGFLAAKNAASNRTNVT